MKYNIILLFITAVTLNFSCSSDKVDAFLEETPLIGTWELTDFIIGDAATSELTLAKIAADRLINDGCNVISYTFNKDNTYSSSTKVDFLQENVVFDGSGLSVTCPENTNTDSGTWVLEENILTVTNNIDVEQGITINLENNMLTLAGEDIDSTNLTDAQVVFSRK